MSQKKESRPTIQEYWEGEEQESEVSWPDGLCIIRILENDCDETYCYRVCYRWNNYPWRIPIDFKRLVDAERALSVILPLGLSGSLEEARAQAHEFGTERLKQMMIEALQW